MCPTSSSKCVLSTFCYKLYYTLKLATAIIATFITGNLPVRELVSFLITKYISTLFANQLVAAG